MSDTTQKESDTNFILTLLERKLEKGFFGKIKINVIDGNVNGIQIEETLKSPKVRK